jgi:hypothetical protein
LFLVQSEFNAIDEVGSISQNYAETSKILEIRNYFRDRKEWESRNPGNNRTNVVAGLRRLDGFTDPDTNELYETYLRHHLHKRRN